MHLVLNAVTANVAHKIQRISQLVALAAFILLTACSSAQRVENSAIESAAIMNLRNPEANVFASGQPTQEQMQVLANSGVKHIINLRPHGEQDWDEKAYVESLGMQYHNIPVAGANDVTLDNANQLNALLTSLEGQPLLVHCASSNRVGALRALIAGTKDGQSPDNAVSTGKNWGLGSLETAVRSRLSE